MENIGQSQEYEKFETEYYDRIVEIIKNTDIFSSSMLHIHPDELLYGKTKLNKVKKTKLGKLVI